MFHVEGLLVKQIQKFTNLQIATGHFVMYINQQVEQNHITFFATNTLIGHSKVKKLCTVLSIFVKLVYQLKEIRAKSFNGIVINKFPGNPFNFNHKPVPLCRRYVRCTQGHCNILLIETEVQ